jgi:hypothetical protein
MTRLARGVWWKVGEAAEAARPEKASEPKPQAADLSISRREKSWGWDFIVPDLRRFAAICGYLR